MHFNSTNELSLAITIYTNFQLRQLFVFNIEIDLYIFSFLKEIDSLIARGTAKKINTRYNRRNTSN